MILLLVVFVKSFFPKNQLYLFYRIINKLLLVTVMKSQNQIEQDFIKRMTFDQYLQYCEYLVKCIEEKTA